MFEESIYIFFVLIITQMGKVAPEAGVFMTCFSQQ